MPKLSRREFEVAQLAAAGLTNRQIAERLFVSERTAEYHLEQIRNKLGLHSRGEIASWLAGQARPETPAANLPTQMTSFVGRGREISAVRSLLDRTRIVTITGAGGTGKTRLAIEVASRLSDRHADGVCFVDLAGVTDPVIVPGQAAAALGAKDLEKGLAGRRQLVLLDNCEHLPGAAADLAQLMLKAAPGLHVLATSRQPLGVAGEGVWPLQPLSQPEAVNLFIDRAGLAAPDLDLKATDTELVHAICLELDNMPLAIELAAPRARTMSLADLHKRLRDRFRLLTGGPRRSERQQTLEATIAWSYGLLTEPQRLLFQRLGVFAGSFFLDSAELVCADGDMPLDSVAELISRLVEQSMVIAERIPDLATRYRLLISLREYARNRLRVEGELEEMRRRHAHRFRRLAEEAGANLEGPDQQIWMQRLDDELDEIRAASEWALEHDPETALALAERLGWFWGLRGRLTEGRRALAAALMKAPALTASRGRALIFAGWLARAQNDVDAGTAFHAESVELFLELNDPIALGTALVWNAEARLSAGDWEGARRGWLDAVDLLEPLGESQPLGYALLELAGLGTRDGDVKKAQTFAARAETMNSHLGNPRAVAVSRLVEAYLQHLGGDPVAGLARTLQLCRELAKAGNVGDLISALEGACEMTLAAGEPEAGAIKLAGIAEMLYRTTGQRPEYAFFPSERRASALAAARARIGAAAYEEAWESGLAMSVEEALAFVLNSSH